MTIECVWFDEQPEGPWQPGWCFPFGYALSEHYKSNVARIRPPISVCLPTRDGRCTAFCVDSHPTDKPEAAWTVDVPWPLVAGTKPRITVKPSIDCVGLYHGYLTDGVIGDDLG